MNQFSIGSGVPTSNKFFQTSFKNRIAELSFSKKLCEKNKFGGKSTFYYDEKFDTKKKSFSFELGNSVLKFERLRIRRFLEQKR
jgi:hypothetical protein